VPLDTVTEDRRYIYKILAAIYLLFLARIQMRREQDFIEVFTAWFFKGTVSPTGSHPAELLVHGRTKALSYAFDHEVTKVFVCKKGAHVTFTTERP
jgi:hypothetical protein